jgi:hypothetical protein
VVKTLQKLEWSKLVAYYDRAHAVLAFIFVSPELKPNKMLTRPEKSCLWHTQEL